MKKYLLLIFYIAIIKNVNSQSMAKVDSLLILAKEQSTINPEKVKFYSNEAFNLATKINYQKGRANAARFLGVGYYLLGDFKEAENNFTKALKINKSINDNKGIMTCLSNLGSVNNVQSNFSVALKYYQDAIKAGEKENDLQTNGITFGNIGVIYSELKNYETAKYYFNKGIELHTKSNYLLGVANGIGNLGNVAFQTKNFNEAITFYADALDRNNAINNKMGVSRECGNLANAYTELGNFEKALEFHKKSLLINEELKNKKGIAVNYQGIGNYYVQQKKWTEALNYVRQANELALKINILDVQKESFESLAVIYENMKQKDSAFISYKKYIEVKEKIDNETNRKQINRLEIQYEFDAKEQTYKTNQLLAAEKILQKDLTLQLNQVQLEKTNKEKDVARLQFLQKEAELTTEQIEKKAQKEQLDLAEKNNLLNKNKLQIQNLELANKEKQKYFYLLGLLLLGFIGGLLWYQNYVRKKTNNKLKRINIELANANNVKTRFFNILNHDLRAPIANLIHFLHLQKNNAELLDLETKKRMEAKTITGAENLLTSMEDMLLWSKGQMENFRPFKSTFTVASIFEDTKQAFANYPKVNFEFHHQNCSVCTDINYLKTIIRNLTNNALQVVATKPNAQIIWNAEQIGDKVQLTVIDNGDGATKEQFKALYDEQAVVGIKTGLGLHLIRDLAKAIDCNVSVGINKNGTSVKLLL